MLARVVTGSPLGTVAADSYDQVRVKGAGGACRLALHRTLKRPLLLSRCASTLRPGALRLGRVDTE
jgi:hypothetical protein